MPAFFGDGYDLYAAPADAIAGYWDSGTVGFTLVAGRFSGSRAIQNSANGAWLVKTSTGTTDTIHHIVCAFQQTAAITGSTLGMYFQLSDGATNQVCIVFRSDGAILLTSATPAGTVLATYTGAVTAANTWYAFEFEVVISAAAGSFTVRKNGNTSNDFTLGSLATRPGTNTQANKLTVGMNATVSSQILDDVLWRSDTASVSFVGDLRCFTRMPATDASVAWSRSGSVVPLTPPFPFVSNATLGTASAYVPFVAPCDGTIATINATVAAAVTATVKGSIFAASATPSPTTVLGSATTLTNPGVGTAAFTFGTPVAVTRGTTYYFGIMASASSGTWSMANNLAILSTSAASVPYASFPVASPPGLVFTGNNGPTLQIIIAPTTAPNAAMVADTQQDGATTYNYSSTVSQSDLYGIAAIGGTPATIIGVTTRAYAQKSDAGTRNVAVQLQSGATNVQSASTALNTTWGWIARNDLVDPATGSAWTATGVNNVSIGQLVTA